MKLSDVVAAPMKLSDVSGDAPAPTEEKPGFVSGVINKFGEIPKDIGKEFNEGTAEVLSGEKELFAADGTFAQRAAGATKVVGGALGQIAAPATGAAKAVVGDPLKQAIPGKAGQVIGETAEDLAAIFGGGEANKIAKMAIENAPKAIAQAQRVMASIPDAMPNMIHATPRAAAVQARTVGYVLPPAMASDKPGMVSNILGGWSGKIKTQQAASTKNQIITNALAKQAIGLPVDAPLTEKAISDVRAKAGQAYEAVKNAVPVIAPDEDFKGLVSGLGGANSLAAKHFPNITKNEDIKNLVKELSEAKEFPTEAGVELVKELRFSGNEHLKALGDPSKHALGLAEREAADAVDDLMERSIVRASAGDPAAAQVVNQYRQARKLIAKTYDVEAATNMASGDVSARAIGKLGAKGRPFTDELKIISDTSNAFPKALQNPSVFGGTEAHSALDFFGSAAALAHGNPSIAAGILGRPVARSMLLSDRYQNRMIGTKPSIMDALTQAQARAAP